MDVVGDEYNLQDLYTHILYLDVDAELIAQRCQADTNRGIHRQFVSVDDLRKRQEAEKSRLRNLCREKGVLFCLLSRQHTLVEMASTLLRDFRDHNEAYNMSRAERKLNEILGTNILGAGTKKLQTMLVLDADGTLAPEHSSDLFWTIGHPVGDYDDTHPFKKLFGSSFKSSYTALRAAVLLYEETVDEDTFNDVCATVASEVHVHPELSLLLQFVADQPHVGVVVVTCGLRAVWEKVLEAEGLSKTVKIIGGGRIADGFVVTPTVKLQIVSNLQNDHHIYVVAFGDSPRDLPMLGKADEAIVVIGEEETICKTIDEQLRFSIDFFDLRASQALLPSSASPRLNLVELPIVQIDKLKFLKSILSFRREPSSSPPNFPSLHMADKQVAKVLMTPAQDANGNGPSLREAHRRIGWYLATQFLTGLTGLEEYEFPPVQGHHRTSGYRLLGEKRTLIVAMMRSADPIAFGVNDALPEAMFVHAKDPEDVLPRYLANRRTVILVDWAINSGKSVTQFAQHIRGITGRQIRIVIVVGVVQQQSIAEGSDLTNMMMYDSNLHLIALRVSENEFIGQGKQLDIMDC
ncbi:uracil phosphoribosyltransferase-domain-containing protein, partial [Nemania sp. FL0916]